MSNTLQSINPSTNDVIGEVAVTTEQQLTDIVCNAKIAAKKWAATPIKERVALISRGFQALQPHQNELAQLMSMEMGKDIRRSMGEVGGVIHSAEHIAQCVSLALHPTNLGGGSEIQYKPLGVVAVISPWNYPLAMAANLIIPSLVAGNTVVFKPSEETPLVADKMVEILTEFLPRHVLQIVQGGKDVGRMLVKTDVNLIAFTGSKQTGVNIMRHAASSLKRLVMELGGNDPMLVLEDANIESAARFAVASSFENAGQMCISTERVYVDEKIADQFETRVVDIAKQYRTGHWDDAKATMGPLVNDRQFQHVNTHIEDAIQKGATVLHGGVSLHSPFSAPTVITGITKKMLIENEETFGPVVAIARYSDISDAISRANDTEYGLGAIVFGHQGAEEVANQLEAGMVGINRGVGGAGDSPWVGAKQSGFGYRGSPDGHRQFTQVRVVSK